MTFFGNIKVFDHDVLFHRLPYQPRRGAPAACIAKESAMTKVVVVAALALAIAASIVADLSLRSKIIVTETEAN
jgi:hypothetical protein